MTVSPATDRGASRVPGPAGQRWLLAAVALLSSAAGVTHLAVAGHHFEEWWLSGVFFVVVAAAQLIFPPLFLVPQPRAALAVAGIVGNLAVVATYAMSRTTGVPIGWHRWTPEDVGLLDFGTTVAEVALIICLLAFVPARLRPWLVNGLFACGLLAWGMRAAGFLT